MSELVGRIAEYWSDEARIAAVQARRLRAPTRIAPGDSIRFAHEGGVHEGVILSRANRLGADTYHVALPGGRRANIQRHQITHKVARISFGVPGQRVRTGEPDKWAVESLAEALGFDPQEHPRGTAGHFARKLSSLHVGETVNLPTAVTVRRHPDGFHVRTPGKPRVVYGTAERAARAALRAHRDRARREKLVPEGDASVRALASRLGYAVPLRAVYPG